jgi:hypothetical protein
VKFSQDASYVLVAEWYSGRVTRWSATNGAYLGTVTTGVNGNDVEECFTGSGTGVVALDYWLSILQRVSEAGASTSMYTTSNPTSIVLLPGRGLLMAAQSISQVRLYSSVAIATHPVSATVAVGGSATFSVTLTANSASTGLTYAWTKDGVPVGTNSASFAYDGVIADGGPPLGIVCTITHALGKAVSNTATLTVQVRPGGGWCSLQTALPRAFVVLQVVVYRVPHSSPH